MEHHTLLHGMRIARCDHPWTAMDGSESVRTCPVCKEKVYRTADLDEKQLLELVAAAEPNKDIAQIEFFRRKDGHLMVAPGRGRLPNALSAGLWFGLAGGMAGALAGVIMAAISTCGEFSRHGIVSGLMSALGLMIVVSVVGALAACVPGALVGQRVLTAPSLSPKSARNIGALTVLLSHVTLGLLCGSLTGVLGALREGASASVIPSIIGGTIIAFAWTILPIIFAGWITFPFGIFAADLLAKRSYKYPLLPKK